MMAKEDAGIMKNLEDITECCICCETLTDPRVLPCIHTFCFRCLEQTGLQMKRLPGHSMPCPVCKEEFTIPEQGWEQLRKNFFMVKLIEMTNATKSSNQIESLVCGICKTRIQTETKSRCIPCGLNLCNNCCKVHRKQNPSHQLKKADGTKAKNVATKLSAATFCRLHPKTSTSLCCTDCSECICTECLEAGHKGHSVLNIDYASVEFRKQIDINIEKVCSSMLKCRAKKDELQHEKVRFLEEMRTIVEEVKSSGRELRDLIQKHTETLVEELSSITQRRVKEIETGNGEIERQLALSESFKQYFTDICNKGSPENICQSMKTLQTMLNEMQVLMGSCAEREISTDKIFLAKTKLDPSTERPQKWNVIGEIKVLTKVTAELKKRLDVPAKGIHGVAKLSGKIYVLCREPNSLYLYADQSPFNFIKEIKAEYIQQPRDMAACVQESCLYIIDGFNLFKNSGNKCVWRITGDEANASSWISNIGSPWTLSVCKDGRVAMLRDEGQLAHLEIYRSDSVLMHSLLMPADVREPLHAVESEAGNFLISCRYGGLWSLCEISVDGQLIAKYVPESDPERLNSPRYLVKYFNDRIIVADCSNHTVVLLNVEPKSSQAILTWNDDAIKRPHHLLLDQDTKQLIVVQGVFRGRKTLNIYSLT